jgi:two-component system, OmpR family, sensor histidine kinase KdpD
MPENPVSRPYPEVLLRRLHAGEKYEARCSFKTFLGYTSSAGKSARMFDEASRRKERGEDVVVGATQPAVSTEVEDLPGKLEAIPPERVGEVHLMDVKSILNKRPQVCAVDTL